MNVVLIAAVIAGAYYFNAMQFKREVKFSVGRVKFDLKKSASKFFSKLYFAVEAKIENPTDFSVTVTGIEAAIYYREKNIATVNRNEQFLIDRNKTISVLADVEVNTLDVFSSMQQAKEMLEAKLVELEITGRVNLTSGVLSINERVKVAF